MAGVAVLVGWSPLPLTPWTALGVSATLAAAASCAGAGVHVRLRLKGVPTLTLALGQQVGALAWLALPGVTWAPRAVPPRGALWAVLALGILCTGVAYLPYFRLLERVGPTKAATITYLLPVFGLPNGAVPRAK